MSLIILLSIVKWISVERAFALCCMHAKNWFTNIIVGIFCGMHAKIGLQILLVVYFVLV